MTHQDDSFDRPVPVGGDDPKRSEDLIECPECKTLSPRGTTRCPQCEYPLVLDTTRQDHVPIDPRLYVKPGDAPGPGRRDDTATWATPTLPGGGLAAGPVCPSCGRENAPDRNRWCEWCGEDLHPRTEPVAASALSRTRQKTTVPWWALLGALLVILVAISVMSFVFHRRAGEPATGTTAPTTPGSRTRSSSPTPTPSVISSSRIKAKASSTNPRGPYAIGNTLDGLKNTAWNSDGDVVGPGPGITLSYDLGRVVRLSAITVRNGYVTSKVLGTNAFAANGRLKRVTVRTDRGSLLWELRDTPKPQTLRAQLGSTRRVTLTVVSVYPGSRFTDLALTDIAFTGVG